MLFLLRYFITRIPREGFRSLTVPALAIVLVMLVNIMGSLRARQEADLEDILSNFEVRVEVSDPITSAADGLYVENRYIELFTASDREGSLQGFVKEVELKRLLHIDHIGDTENVEDIGSTENIEDDFSADETEDAPSAQIGRLVGVTSTKADGNLSPVMGAYIEFFDGYGEGIFRTDENICVVSEAVFRELDTENPVLTVWARSTIPIEQLSEVEGENGESVLEPVMVPAPIVKAELSVVGLLYGAGNNVYCPFWTASDLGTKSDGNQAYSEIMCALMKENRRIGDFKAQARTYFVAAGVVDIEAPLALTVFDGVFIETTKELQQNILTLEIATPFIYFVSACIGFIASFLLTRRRKPEFAIMRSIGIGKTKVFAGALAEQAVLFLAGVIIGCTLFYVYSGYIAPAPPAVLLVCYIIGSVVSAAKAAGTDVMRIMRDKG